MQVREDCGLDPDGSHGDDQTWLDSGYFFILISQNLLKSFDVRCERNGGVRNES